jgi:chemotaxis protein methyltransferase CheR
VSYGAEAYTLAALCLEEFGADARVDIKGTDIDPRMIERALVGSFSAADARDAPPQTLERYFVRDTADTWVAGPQLRRLVNFEVDDLLRAEFDPEGLDLILCRNTVIYFEPAVRDELHARFAAALRPGGRLVVGASERVSAPADRGLIPEHPFVYRKG